MGAGLLLAGADATFNLGSVSSSRGLFVLSLLVINMTLGIAVSLFMWAAGELSNRSGRPLLYPGLVALVLTAMVLALNIDLISGSIEVHPTPGLSYTRPSPIPTWLGLVGVGSGGLLYGVFLASLVGKRIWMRRGLLFGGWISAIFFCWANARLLPGLYPHQHLTLTALCWAIMVPALRVPFRHVGRGVKPRKVALLACLVVAGASLWLYQIGASLGEASPSVRLGLKYRAMNSAAALRLFTVVLDVDRDGYLGLFDGGDCQPFDGEISSAAIERAGDGVDQNCIGGDPTEAQVDELQSMLSGGAERNRADQAKNVLFITVDAWRADTPMPRSEEWMRPRCTYYPRGYCALPQTEPALTSLFTSTFPVRPRADRAGRSPSVVELFRDAGYRTAAFAFWPAVLDIGALPEGYGPGRGFEDIWITPDQSLAAQAAASDTTLHRAWDWLEQYHRESWFLWVHLFNPHSPYLPHEDPPPTNQADLYQGEIEYTDQYLSLFLDSLRNRTDMVAVITSDHGEELLERGTVGHASCSLAGTLYDEAIRVPLVVRYPRCLPRGEIIETQVCQIDIMPTIFDMLGLQMPVETEGHSFLPLIHDRRTDVVEETFAETRPCGWQTLKDDHRRIWCIRTPKWKLIYNDLEPQAESYYELFDLEKDCGERNNVFEHNPGIAENLKQKLHEWMNKEQI